MQMPCVSYGKGVRLSLRVSVCHVLTLSKRRKLESPDLHPQVPEGLVSGSIKLFQNFEKGHPDRAR